MAEHRGSTYGYYDHATGQYVQNTGSGHAVRERGSPEVEVDEGPEIENTFTQEPSFVMEGDSNNALQVSGGDAVVQILGEMGRALGTVVNGIRQFNVSLRAEIGGWRENQRITTRRETAGAPASVHIWTREEYGDAGQVTARERHKQRTEAQEPSFETVTDTRRRVQQPTYLTWSNQTKDASLQLPMGYGASGGNVDFPRSDLTLVRRSRLLGVIPFFGKDTCTIEALDALEKRDARRDLAPDGWHDPK